MTAAEIVALAQKGAAWWFARPETMRAADLAWPNEVLLVYDDGFVALASSLSSVGRSMANEHAVLSCRITPENTASEEALARALVASAIREKSDGYTALLGIGEKWVEYSHGHILGREKARVALLDSLLATPEAAR